MRLALPALLAMLAATAAAAQAPLEQGTLVFASTRALNYGAADLFTLDARGRRRNITQSPGIHDGDADLSPDGSKIVFSRQAGAELDLFTITAAGRELRRLTATPRLREHAPVWAPTGGAVAFMRETPNANSHDLWIADGNGDERRLTSTPGTKSTVAWATDGRRLAFVDVAAAAIFVVNSDGSGLRRLTRGEPALERPPLFWMRSGIVTSRSKPQAQFALRLLNPETGASRPLSNPCGGQLPDTRQTVVSSRAGGNGWSRSGQLAAGPSGT